MPQRPTAEEIAGSRLPPEPEIDLSVLVSPDDDVAGEIVPGDVFAWEPFLPWARKLVVVTGIVESARGPLVMSAPYPGAGYEIPNPEDIFRSACARTSLPRVSPAAARPGSRT